VVVDGSGDEVLRWVAREVGAEHHTPRSERVFRP